MPELSDFRPTVDTTFALEDGVELRLVEAEPNGAPAPSSDRDPFRLTFVGPVDPLLPQRIYRLDHTELGALEIFLVPIARDTEGTTYEAIFS
jgi:hypothetical protein